MKFIENIPDDAEQSITQRIVEGNLAIGSADELEEILNIYPDDPQLHRKYADLLAEEGRHERSAMAYHQAAAFFIRQGMTLQAVVAKILQWSIQKANHDQGREFHSLLHTKGARHTPLERFWSAMTYPQLVAVMRRLVRIRVPAEQYVVRCGEQAGDIFFVVSGSLIEKLSAECEEEALRTGVQIDHKLLGHNDIFGDVFPLNGPSYAQRDVQAVADSELVKIAKPVLHEICAKYPYIESSLQLLYKFGNRDRCDRVWQSVRRFLRYGLPTKVELTIEPSRLKGESWKQICVAQDISLGGICADLGSLDSKNGRRQPFFKGRSVRLKLDLPNQNALNLMGKIVWHREQIAHKGSNHYVGIRFDPLSNEARDTLDAYCKAGVGEQDLLMSLWDKMVRTDAKID
jgi:hypothetical protein